MISSLIAADTARALTWTIAGLATAGVIVRPFRWPEAAWAIAGAIVLVALGLVRPGEAWTGIGKGLDVYLFLIGMMLLSELARREGLFDWLAAKATAAARGSPQRLFLLVYALGTLITVFLSNDATAVVLTPAVYAATRAARVKDPLPYLYICAFIANAASFVLPISNPANLVVFAGDRMPPLGEWLSMFALPSVVAIVLTYLVLRVAQARPLSRETLAREIDGPRLPPGGSIAAAGLGLTAVVLLAASALGLELGLPTLLSAGLTALAVLARNRQSPLPVLRGVDWGVLPLVAGLFVLVEALDRTGLVRQLAGMLRSAAEADPRQAAFGTGTAVAIVTNLVNNLPAGLVAGSAVAIAAVPRAVSGAVMIGVDLGPNISVTGSLATILWLGVLRREGVEVGAWQFLKLGIVVTLPALFAALGVLVYTHM